MNDTELMLRYAQTGCESCFSTLYRRYDSKVRRWTSYNDDASQDAWLRVILYRNRYREEMPFPKWLCILAKQARSRQGKRHEVSLQFDPAQPVKSKTDQFAINLQVGALPPAERSVIRSLYWDERTIEETARFLEMSVQNVRTLRAKALSILSQI